MLRDKYTVALRASQRIEQPKTDMLKGFGLAPWAV